MASSDADQKAILQGESSELPVAAQDGQANHISQTNSQPSFHRYMNLPAELRAQIRQAAIEAAKPYPIFLGSSSGRDEQSCYRLAAVSKEWQDDVERALFGQVRIDPLDEEDVATFKEHFTDKRRRFLTRIEIAIDDDQSDGPWHKKMGLLEISEVMEKVGQFFQYINGWDFCRDGERQQCLEIIFISTRRYPGIHLEKDEEPCMTTSSIWDETERNIVTGDGLIPINMVLWAVKSEFPLSLNMVTHLTFSPDCVPLPATRRIIQAMPNLQTCLFEVSFGSDSEDGWNDLTDLIRELRASLPLLRNLTLHNQMWVRGGVAPARMALFAAVLRDYSQGLECLRVTAFDLHHAFFLPSSKELGSTLPPSKWQWPRLRHLELKGFCEPTDSDLPTITPTDILVAAGRAATAMPALKTAEISLDPDCSFSFKGPGSFKDGRVCISGFEESDEQRVLTAWAPFVGGKTSFTKDKKSMLLPPSRIFEGVTK